MNRPIEVRLARPVAAAFLFVTVGVFCLGGCIVSLIFCEPINMLRGFAESPPRSDG